MTDKQIKDFLKWIKANQVYYAPKDRIVIRDDRVGK